MAKGFNKVVLMGNLTRDPEVRNLPSGQTVTNFGLAVNRTWRDQDGNTQENVSFIDCVAWGKAGEIIAQYVQKGRALLVSGRLDQRSWEDKEGQKRSKVEVVVEDFNFVGGGGAAGSSGDDSPSSNSGASSTSSKPAQSKKQDEQSSASDDEEPINLDDIPF